MIDSFFSRYFAIAGSSIMATATLLGAEPLRKRQKLDNFATSNMTESWQGAKTTCISQHSQPPNLHLQEPRSSQPANKPSSSFNFASGPPFSASIPKHDYTLDINKYIPVGCLRVQRSDCGISHEIWKSCSSWSAFTHPRDIYGTPDDANLPNILQERLLSSPVLRQYRVLHNAGWIRMEFQAKDLHSGQVRVYILPDDVGRRFVDRQQTTPRRSMQLLLAQLDISKATWDGEWQDDKPVVHVDASLDAKEDDSVSLFYIFNTLPSPKPNPETVADQYARDAMYGILDSKIEGLTTIMHPYQRRTAAMMLQREAQPCQVIDPRLRPIVDQNGNIWYCDLDAASCLREPRRYESSRGGICAETMGLGKTLICLALILATKEFSSQIPVEYTCGTVPVRKTTGSLKDMAAGTIGRTGTPWKSYFAQMEARGYDYSQCVDAIRKGAGYYYLPGPEPRRESRNPVIIPPRKIWLTTATIVVVPPNLVRQWELEIKKHTTGILKVLVMKKSRAKEPLPSAKELAEYDVILFSKQRFDQEAADGSDNMGRRKSTTSNICRCPYIGNTRERDCNCFREEDAYRSPLKDLHIKRLITDEGHTFGNSSKSSRTEGVTVVEFLQLSARWIISGTPTQGLYGAEVSLSNSEDSSESTTPVVSDDDKKALSFAGSFTKSLATLPDSDAVPSSTKDQGQAFYKQERKDLEKLGNIATVYLKARPWANTYQDGDIALWSQHVMQPRHGSKSHGNMDCLRSTLEGMIIRHRPEDVEQDVTLPPLYQSAVHLEGSIQDKLSLNMFSMMIVSNAVTSERKDADYLFHPRQRKALNQLVSNLRQASFHWSGYTMTDVLNTIEVAKKFLESGEVPVSSDDEILLREAIKCGEIVLANNIKKAISHWHEMPMYIQNECPDDVRIAWTLDADASNPSLMGATMVHSAQKFLAANLWKEDPMEGLVAAGKHSLELANLAANPPASSRPAPKINRDSKSNRKADHPAPILAGGVTVVSEASSNPKKRPRGTPGKSSVKSIIVNDEELEYLAHDKAIENNGMSMNGTEHQQTNGKLKSALSRSNRDDSVGTLDPSSPLASLAIISTSSAKLSYLMDRIVAHYEAEKILVFYEADNVAYYIAQALECLGIKHLIYAKSLASARKAQYVVTFNQTETFRVLLMDISQAAFGLDMSSASRVYFVNPVFSPQVEAQAVKRAHRIGQKKPVYVETLILRGSIEEIILDRRQNMTNEEHNKCKSILDDEKMYDWIRNVRFLPVITDGIPGPEQMAKLQTPQLVLGRGSGVKFGTVHDPDADLLLDDMSPKAKGKRKARVAFGELGTDDNSSDSSLGFTVPTKSGSPSVKAHAKETSRVQNITQGLGFGHSQVLLGQEESNIEEENKSRGPQHVNDLLGAVVAHATEKPRKSVAFRNFGDGPTDNNDIHLNNATDLLGPAHNSAQGTQPLAQVQSHSSNSASEEGETDCSKGVGASEDSDEIEFTIQRPRNGRRVNGSKFSVSKQTNIGD